MILRLLSSNIDELIRYFPAIYVGGSRQSGKTTLLRSVFHTLPYVNLENPDTRMFADNDPRAFLSSFPKGAILDGAA